MSTLTVFVQSKIRSPSTSPLSPATFKQWYEQIHIPDLLALPEITSAGRFVKSDIVTPDDELAAAGFPYLAVYPGLSREWLKDERCGFLKVPLHSEILPGEKGFVFDVADFEMGGYEVLGRVKRRAGEGRGMVVVPVEGEVVEGKGWETVVGESRGMLELGEGEGESVVMRYDFSPTGMGPREKEVGEGVLFVGGRYLVLHQLESLPPKEVPEQWGKKPVVYSLIRAFGESEGPLI
ncbi:hypothetical protein B0T14DRAFT_568425 [Immersiella caudata]|uniref:Uncharacterized protein n=1 Tax=Immersiella caudata TaxID=314043 RepID=A0AA39WK27_9PEZI|nr:hypothetical protein B0T14DRAFT_568425 [Immersiella caudata]